MNSDDSLTALISRVKSHKILVYDLESKDGPTQKPGFTRVFLGGVFDGARFMSFRNHDTIRFTHQKEWDKRAIADGGCLDQLLRYILQRQYRHHYIYAHNGGAFDHLHLLPWFTKRIEEFSYKIIPIQSTIQVLKVTERSTNNTFTFLDSIRLLPMSLDKAAKTFGFPGKLTHSLDVDENNRSWEKYVQRDCEALYESLNQFQHLIVDRLGGEMGITSPSTSMKLYRRKFMGHGKTPAIIPQHRHFKECDGGQTNEAGEHIACEGCQHTFIRAGYFGGRTEVFRKGGQGLSYYDINSSYPRAMLEDMPGGVVKNYGPKKGPKDFERLSRDAIGFIECDVEIPETCYLPPLPHRAEKTRKLLFPVGKFHGVWSYAELQLLNDPLVNGKITSVTRSVWYGRQTLFFDFVKELYAFRDKEAPTYDEGLALISKLMMNSLYGKFGMNEDRREILLLKKEETVPEGATFPRHLDGEEDLLSRVCYVEKRVSPPYIIPQISAHITALARVRLWNFMAEILRRGGKLYYCDTDSIITDLDDLPVSSDLGELKNEYPGEKLDVELIGLKMYMLQKTKTFDKEHDSKCHDEACGGCSKVKLAMRGVPKDKRTVDTISKFKKGETIYFGRLEKLGAMAERGFQDSPRMHQTSKSHKAKYDKRIFLDNEDTVPVVLGD